ncbi:electron transfer flavoprotein subunit alpha/FixB family protein [Clostridium formicaceticum]|uniref:Acryloyl-CoA reductase electron transfer subunit beta n=1 Tax=Clostridium formicaceticum TaxID=1497 RepID=A0AAC9WIC7_9CLOT|nr:electron transfer flavoprotein subunit alpha/FixB family protein [Clostridium formicaceticum]AOY75221.1 electron transfer flavoprotein subunit alpha [Clostridium formicaceticum]ARE89654.1 Acryloyl-CoA reductase electron transfer subunit beta [Clostridium formicaceticum]
MAKIIVNQEKIKNVEETLALCPFNAIENNDGVIEINAACKMCKICVNKGDEGAFQLVEEKITEIDKKLWKGIAVYVDHLEGEIHPVTMELIGKAKELAVKLSYPIYAVFIGDNVYEKAQELLHYGVDEVFVYDEEPLKHFRIEPYTAAFEDFIHNKKPSIVLVGATTVGRSLAPRVSARFKTGLTADCTILDVKENSDLIQIRPAFGGNIMAKIITPNHRPQFATVRYKVMTAAEPSQQTTGRVTKCPIALEKLTSQIKVIDVKPKEQEEDISEAEMIVVAGRGVKSQKDLDMIYKLAEKLGAQVASTRPLIEAGWGDAKKQIGLSGRTVRPKLLITCGVSGSVQFVAGMSNAECIFAINQDESAPIFKVAHYGVVGDIYEVIPRLIEEIDKGNIKVEDLKSKVV